MRNIRTSMSKEGVLTVTIDTTKKLGPSSSGKNILVASTGGGVQVEGAPFGFKVNVSAWVPKR